MLETRCLRPLPKMYQTHDSSLGEAIPKVPLRVVDLSRMATRGKRQFNHPMGAV